MYNMKSKKRTKRKTKTKQSKTKKRYHKKSTYDIYKQQILHYKKSPT
jgi:hypothetical protein